MMLAMRRATFFGVLSFLVGVQGVGASAAAVRPPDRVYTYSVVQGTTVLSSAVVTVSTSGKNVHVVDKGTVGGVTGDVQFDLDDTTLAQSHYAGSLSSAGTTVNVTVSSDGPLLRILRIKDQVIAVYGAPDTQAMIVSDNLISSFIFIPAIVTATGTKAIAELSLGTGQALRSEITPGTEAGTLTMLLGSLHLQYTYDPATLVVKRIHVLEQNLDILLAP